MPLPHTRPFARIVRVFNHVIRMLLLAGAATCTAPVMAAMPEYIPSRYIVVFRDDVDVDIVANDLAGRLALGVAHRYRYALKGMTVTMPAQLLVRLAADPRVAQVEQDAVVRAAAQTLSTGIDRVDGELNPAARIDGVDVIGDRVDVDIAILDTGVDFDHPELDVVMHVYCKTQGPINANCVEGDPGADDVKGHGTHVAGIAAAIDNNGYTVGMAPGARVWNVKVLEDDGTGSVSQVIAGIDYVTQHASEIELANLSLSGTGSVPSLDMAISNSVAAGVVYALAAGNDSVDVSNAFPAGHPDAITVSAFQDYDGKPGGLHSNPEDDTFANFSNYGAGVDIMAPGVAIRSLRAGGGVTYKTGTSQATPHVAGAAALYMSENPGATPAEVKAALLADGDVAPCVNGPNGTCADDPDGIQEPLLRYVNLADGDLTGDGVVDARDVVEGQRIIADGVTPPPPQMQHGDIAPLVAGVPQPDGIFNVADLLLITRIALGDLAL